MDFRGKNDPIYEDAKQVVIAAQSASIAGLQRRMVIGYNRAACLIEAMEEDGIVSGFDATGKRVVLARPTPEAKP